ncbi:MAG TPA: DinB family protein [Thermoanaerobaculia bacterium]
MSEKHTSHTPHAAVIERLKSQGEDVRRLCAGLDEEAIARRVIPEKWSVKEVLAHIARVQQVFEGRLLALLTTDDPAIESYEPEGDPEFDEIVKKSSGELLQWFEDTRGRILLRLEGLGKDGWHRRGKHPEFPAYDVHFCMEYMGHHEAHHVYQMFVRRAMLPK